MPTFVIERAIPEASKLTKRELQEIARASNEVVTGLGVPYTWLHSYVAPTRSTASTGPITPTRSASTPDAGDSPLTSWSRSRQ
jgi:hypothetical protein